MNFELGISDYGGFFCRRRRQVKKKISIIGDVKRARQTTAQANALRFVF